MSEDTAQDAAKAEAGRQAVALAGGLAFVLLASWLERKGSEPDGWRTLKMTAAREAERAAARAAGRLWRLAERARLAYEGERG